MMKKCFTLALALAASSALATTPAPLNLKYQTGTIPLLNGTATLQTGPGLRYLNADGARQVIVDGWGNPEGAASDVLGMIVPAGTDPMTQAGWGVVITESRDVHVSDSDAAKINYDQLLKDMQRGVQDENTEREQAGYPTLDLIGWADQPHYDAATHKMYWAKELSFDHDDAHTLNYAVRVLGRDNVLELNAVAGMTQLPQIKRDMAAVLSQVTFNPGSRYEDFNGSTDKVATYGIAGLVGVVAAKKLGLLALLPLLLKKGWIVLVAAFAALRRLFGGRRAEA